MLSSVPVSETFPDFDFSTDSRDPLDPMDLGELPDLIELLGRLRFLFANCQLLSYSAQELWRRFKFSRWMRPGFWNLEMAFASEAEVSSVRPCARPLRREPLFCLMRGRGNIRNNNVHATNPIGTYRAATNPAKSLGHCGTLLVVTRRSNLTTTLFRNILLVVGNTFQVSYVLGRIWLSGDELKRVEIFGSIRGFGPHLRAGGWVFTSAHSVEYPKIPVRNTIFNA